MYSIRSNGTPKKIINVRDCPSPRLLTPTQNEEKAQTPQLREDSRKGFGNVGQDYGNLGNGLKKGGKILVMTGSKAVALDVKEKDSLQEKSKRVATTSEGSRSHTKKNTAQVKYSSGKNLASAAEVNSQTKRFSSQGSIGSNIWEKIQTQVNLFAQMNGAEATNPNSNLMNIFKHGSIASNKVAATTASPLM